MKLEIEIPEWAANRHLFVFAGLEPLAIKEFGKPLRIKKSHCNLCGRCCMNLPEKLHPFGVKENGDCKFLQREPGPDEKYICGVGHHRPFGCCIFDPKYRMPECTVEYEEVK